MNNNQGVHASHCCKWHGCKYGDKDCPVQNGEVEQEYLCDFCHYELDDAEYHTQVVARLPKLYEMKIKSLKRQFIQALEEAKGETHN